jgi:hypothetical protein
MGGAQAELIHFGGIHLQGIGHDLEDAISIHEEFVMEGKKRGMKEFQSLSDSWKTAGRTTKITLLSGRSHSQSFDGEKMATWALGEKGSQ